MNLKEAAAELGVHYQTAYKWVRSGVLPAVRIGARYEISQQGLEVFTVRRRRLAATPQVIDELAGVAPSLSVDDLIEEAEAMTLDPLLSTQAIVAYAARRGSEVFGELCIASLETSAGETVTVVDHPRPDWITFVLSALELAPQDPDDLLPILKVVRQGQPVRITHVPLDVLATRIRPERRQFLEQYPVCTVLAVPVRRGDRHYGHLILTRSSPDRVYLPEAERAAVTFGNRLADLVTTAHEIQGAWELRQAVADALAEWARRAAPPLTDDVAQAVLDTVAGDSRYGVCILDPAGRLVALNPAFAAGSDPAHPSPLGSSYLDLVAPEFAGEERARFERLVSGAFDYDDFKAVSPYVSGRVGFYGFHRCAVRRSGADLVGVVSVARALRGSPDRSTVVPVAGRDEAPLPDRVG
jgi:excisionase family DNA binding protein